MSRAPVAMQAVVEAGNVLGEGILWCERAQALYWTDIHAATLWRHTPASGETRQWQLSERLASFALCETEGWLLLALASRLAFFHLDDGALYPICAVEPDLPTRCNDGACDRQGRFVFGTLHEPVGGGAKQAIGGFWRLNARLELEKLPLENVAISNSLAFSPDGGTLYFCDSPTRTIHCCAYGDTLGPSRVFAVLDGEHGVPDGSCVDAEGGLWNAQWGLARVVRYCADGSVDRVLPLPISQPTRPAFGGAALDTLYVVSAREDLDAAALTREPLAGALFAARIDFRGVPEPRFAGTPPRDTTGKPPLLSAEERGA